MTRGTAERVWKGAAGTIALEVEAHEGEPLFEGLKPFEPQITIDRIDDAHDVGLTLNHIPLPTLGSNSSTLGVNVGNPVWCRADGERTPIEPPLEVELTSSCCGICG